MYSILGSVSTEKGSDRTWCLHLSLCGISWSDEISPFLNSSVSNEFHTNTHIAGHESLQITKEWFSNMFTIKYIGSFLSKFRHFQFVDHESLALDSINNLANILVRVRFDHGKSGFSFTRLFNLSGNITILYDRKNSAKNCNFCSNMEVRESNLWHLNSLEENSAHLFVIHFDGVIQWEEKQSVVSDDIGLLVVPFDFENVSHLFDRLG